MMIFVVVYYGKSGSSIMPRLGRLLCLQKGTVRGRFPSCVGGVFPSKALQRCSGFSPHKYPKILFIFIYINIRIEKGILIADFLLQRCNAFVVFGQVMLVPLPLLH